MVLAPATSDEEEPLRMVSMPTPCSATTLHIRAYLIDVNRTEIQITTSSNNVISARKLYDADPWARLMCTHWYQAAHIKQACNHFKSQITHWLLDCLIAPLARVHPFKRQMHSRAAAHNMGCAWQAPAQESQQGGWDHFCAMLGMLHTLLWCQLG
jgi:hypothetical protein